MFRKLRLRKNKKLSTVGEGIIGSFKKSSVEENYSTSGENGISNLTKNDLDEFPVSTKENSQTEDYIESSAKAGTHSAQNGNEFGLYCDSEAERSEERIRISKHLNEEVIAQNGTKLCDGNSLINDGGGIDLDTSKTLMNEGDTTFNNNTSENWDGEIVIDLRNNIYDSDQCAVVNTDSDWKSLREGTNQPSSYSSSEFDNNVVEKCKICNSDQNIPKTSICNQLDDTHTKDKSEIWNIRCNLDQTSDGQDDLPQKTFSTFCSKPSDTKSCNLSSHDPSQICFSPPPHRESPAHEESTPDRNHSINHTSSIDTCNSTSDNSTNAGNSDGFDLKSYTFALKENFLSTKEVYIDDDDTKDENHRCDSSNESQREDKKLIDMETVLVHQPTVDNVTESNVAEMYTVVIAIDFGVTYSGYAFSFVNEPLSIYMMRKWDDRGVFNHKAPTTVLLDPDEVFHSFGFAARDHYHNLSFEEASRWYLFEKFKMKLHHDNLSKDMEIQASNGKYLPALTIFTHALRYLKEHALRELGNSLSIDAVRWVLTVPALWKSSAKQFMRLAAYEAGIADADHPNRLLIALEPEAASIYCRSLKKHQLASKYYSPYYQLHSPQPILLCHKQDPACVIKSGTRYMVVDCGGGTVDITVHEMTNDQGHLMEVYKATGGPFGSMGVDLQFERLLYEIFGEEFIEDFRVKHPIGWIDFMAYFESRKRATSPFITSSSNISIPFAFIEFHKKYHKDKDVKTSISKYRNPLVQLRAGGMLMLDHSVISGLFKDSWLNICTSVGDILNIPECKDLSYLFLVGGFAESPLLQHMIHKEFDPLLTVIIPEDVSLAVLKGAVMYGLDPLAINLRRSKLSYGVGVLKHFQPSVHPPEKLVHREGVDWCNDAYEEFVSIDQPITLGEAICRNYVPVHSGQLEIKIKFYSTDKPNVQFITDPSITECGVLTLDMSEPSYLQVKDRREIEARMLFGDTEIKVSALDLSSGTCVKASLDFMNIW